MIVRILYHMRCLQAELISMILEDLVSAAAAGITGRSRIEAPHGVE